MSRTSKTVLTLWKMFAAFCTVMFLLTFAFPFIFIAAVVIIAVIIISRKAKNDPPAAVGKLKSTSAALAVIVIIVLGTPPITIESPFKWQYPFQRVYLGMYNNINAPEDFPDFLVDVQSGYKFEYIPSVLQGTGHYSVTFVTSSERAAEYAADLGSKARCIIPLSDYMNSISAYSVEEPNFENAEDGTLHVYISERMKNNHSDKAQIYVLSAVLNFNHPHSTAIIVDTETGYVQLSQLG